MPAEPWKTPFRNLILEHTRRDRARRAGLPGLAPPLYTNWLEGIFPGLRDQADQASRGLRLHSHVAAVNSSMAFGFNLFLPFQVAGASTLEPLLSQAVGRPVVVENIHFEFGPSDILAESRSDPPGPNDTWTAADVGIEVRDEHGQLGIVLVEVKLAEAGFTNCGRTFGPHAQRTEACDSASFFFADPDQCYLRRPLRSTRDRRYWTIFGTGFGSVRSAFPGLADNGPCPFRSDLQQPMRNHALALGLVQAGRYAFARVGLVHHDGNPDVPPHWERYTNAVADPQTLFRLPASAIITVGEQLHVEWAPEWAQYMRERYRLAEPPAGRTPLVKPSFRAALSSLRSNMGRSIAVPSSAEWRLEPGEVVARMPAEDLGRNIQENAAAVPWFALCLAYWFERFRVTGTGPVRARIELVGSPADSPHTLRSLFVLHELSRALPDHFRCDPLPDLRLPAHPKLNAAIADRDAGAKPENGGEHAIEVAFTRQVDLAAQFDVIEPIDGFWRQLPLGLFDGEVSQKARWTPGGKSQVDLWAMSRDGTTAHVFELKAAGNSRLGILPEAFWYAMLLSRVRTNDLGGAPVTGGGPAVDRVRSAQRVRMWLLAPELHPLVWHDGASPLEWLRPALAAQGVGIGILPYRQDATGIRLDVERVWR